MKYWMVYYLLGIIDYILIWLLRDMLYDTLISYKTILRITLHISGFCWLIFGMSKYLRKFYTEVSGKDKIQFVGLWIIAPFYCIMPILISGVLLLNRPWNCDNATIIKCPIKKVNRSYGRNPGFTADIDVNGTEFTLNFPSEDDSFDLFYAKYIQVRIVKGNLGYDYVVDKEIILE